MYLLIRNAPLFFKKNTNLSCVYRSYCAAQQSLSLDDPSQQFKEITGGDAELEHKLRVIILEADVMRQDGKCVPSFKFIKTHQWQEMIKLETRSARSKYLTFLFKNEKMSENRARKKAETREQIDSIPKQFKTNCQKLYQLGGNHFFLRIYESTMNQMYNNKLMQAIQFGQKLVVDLGYDKNMTNRENKNCAKQLMLLFSENRYHNDPFDLHFCNINKNSSLALALHRYIPPMYNIDFPLNIHEKSYLDIFPRDQLVYLTPHCKEVLENYDHDSIYIIGGLVDKVNNEPLSLAKAKEEGLRMAKLPLDLYLHWGSGSGKSLTLNQVTSILLDVRETGNWNHSLRHVPRRKLHDREIGPKKFQPGYCKNNTNYSEESVIHKLLQERSFHRRNSEKRKTEFNIKTIFKTD